MDTTRASDVPARDVAGPEPVPEVPGYELGDPIGRGASSVVWRAHRHADGATVAVKLVATCGEGDGEGDRAVREFEVLRRLPVEGLVRVHEAFTLPADHTRVAVVLDLVRGGSLQSVLTARGHLTAGEAVTVVSPVARTLAGLHALGVVHGDVSPGNVLLERSGRPLLADLGVARLVGEAPAELFGTPGFTAPEVEAGKQPTSSSDVYAVGALAWACVTGEPPAPVGLRGTLAELAPGLPQDWLDVVTACLSSLPEERPDAAEVALRLFDSAPCEPLRLVAGDDEVSLITHRLRAATPAAGSHADETDEADGSGLARPRLTRLGLLPLRPTRPRPTRPRATRPRGTRPRLTGPRVLPLRPPHRRLLLGGAAVLAVSLAVGLLAPVASRWFDRAEAAEQVRPPSGTAAVSAVLQDRAAPRTRTAELARALADVRAQALTSSDRATLARLDVPGSAALRADQALLEELRARGERYDGVRFDVRSAVPVTVGDDHATLRCVVDTGAHGVIRPDGTRVERPAERGAPLLLHLRWSEGRWRVEAVAGTA